MGDEMPAPVKAKVLRRRAAQRPIWVEVTGQSMGASIPTGARVLLETGMRPRRGEVWAFINEEGSLVVHRFKRAVGGLLWFEGDANTTVDRPVTSDLLVGRVTEVEIAGRRRRLGTRQRLRGRVLVDRRALGRRISRLGGRLAARTR